MLNIVVSTRFAVSPFHLNVDAASMLNLMLVEIRHKTKTIVSYQKAYKSFIVRLHLKIAGSCRRKNGTKAHPTTDRMHASQLVDLS